MKESGMKQKAVAKKSGFEEQEFSNMMNGRKEIKAEYIPRIAKALNSRMSSGIHTANGLAYG